MFPQWFVERISRQFAKYNMSMTLNVSAMVRGKDFAPIREIQYVNDFKCFRNGSWKGSRANSRNTNMSMTLYMYTCIFQ